MRRNVFAFAVLAVAGVVGSVAVARAQPLVQSQEGIALENQILQLQQQVQQLQSSAGSGSALGGGSAPPAAPSGSAPSSDALTNLLGQVQDLQTEVQQLSGRIDTLQNQVDTQHAATEKEIGDLNFKVTGGTGTAPVPGAPGAGTPPAGDTPAGTPQNLNTGVLGTLPANPGTPAGPATPATPADPPVAATPKTALKAAEAAMAQRDYASAESDARTVLATAKSSPYGYHAQYILAEALYSENKPSDAAIAYDDAYNQDRTGTYAPGSLLGLANSLAAINQNSAACDTLASLKSQFPSLSPGMAARVAAASKRASCS